MTPLFKVLRKNGMRLALISGNTFGLIPGAVVMAVLQR